MLEAPTDGQILFQNQLVNDPKRSHRAQEQIINTMRMKIGMVFQQFNLFPHLTVLENVTLAPIQLQGVSRQQANTEADALLEKVGVLDKRCLLYTSRAPPAIPCTAALLPLREPPRRMPTGMTRRRRVWRSSGCRWTV